MRLRGARAGDSKRTITINHRFTHDHLIKLSISHALSQSTKLCVFEERVLEIVQQTRDLPEALANTGTACAMLASYNQSFTHDHLIKLSISHALSQSTKLCVFEERVLEIVQQTRDLPEALANTGTACAMLASYNQSFTHDHLIKLSISHALSQSTKLCVFEERVLEIVQQTRDLPEALANTGTACAMLASYNQSFTHDHLIKLSISHALSQSTKLCVFEERVLENVQHTRDLPAAIANTGTA